MNSKFSRQLLAMLVVLIPGSNLASTEGFVEVSGERGIGSYTNANGLNAGAAVADYDNDGDLDIFVPNGHGVADQLYRNLGAGQFEEIAASLGLDSPLNNRGALWFDYDGDADLDLLVAADDYLRNSSFLPSNLTLYRQNGDGSFSDVTAISGLFGALNDPIANPQHHLGGLAAGDLDNDGFPELLVSFWHGYAYLYQNNGDSTFTQSFAIPYHEDTYWQTIITDFDRDGFQDVFMAVDFNENFFFHNQGDGSFIEMGAALGMQNDEENDMGVALGDVDNDGDLDFFVSNIYSGGIRRNHLYVNESVPGVPQFQEIAVAAGVADTGWGWGASFADFDNDTFLDLAVTNGFTGEDDPSRMFHHQGGVPPVFVDVAAATGFDDTFWGACLLSFDADNDGDLDFLQTTVDGPLRLLDNINVLHGGYLRVRPRMRTGNRFALGAIVKIEIGTAIMTRAITAGTSMLCQEPAEAFFGIGSADVIDRVTVQWPGGGTSVVTQVPVNQTLTIDSESIFKDGMESGSTLP